MTYVPPMSMGTLAPALFNGFDPLAGGSLSIGPTGLGNLAGQIGGAGPMPYGNPIGSLMRGPAAPQLLPRLGTTAGQIASDAASLRPLASSMAPMPADLGLATQLGRAAGGNPLALRPGLTPLRALGRVGGGAFLGQLGSGLIDQMNPGGQNSNIEQGLQGAAVGAGIGGSIGSIVPGVGTAIGALAGGGIGGAVGVLSNMFGGGGGGDEAPEIETVLANAIASAGLDELATERVLTTYETQMALAEQYEGDARVAAEDAAREAAGQQILMEMQQAQSALASGLGGASGGPGNTLALQQQAASIFQPLAQDIRTNASLYAQAMEGIMPNLPESYRGVAQAQMARELTSADKMANAYIAQAALTPVAQQLSQYQRDQQAFANQLWSQTLAQQAAGATGGGGAATDISSLLANIPG